MTPDLPTLGASKKLTTDYLEAYFDGALAQSHTIDSSYERLWHAMRKIALQGGKRLRPYLVFVGFGSLDQRVVPIAAAQELLHIALLVHDDVIDRDDQRHGALNINGIYKSLYNGKASSQDASHYAYSAAILAGDLLFSAAYELISLADQISLEDRRIAQKLLGKSIFDVAAGELMDTEAAFMDGAYDPLTIYHYKTASYSFRGPLLTGARLAHLPESQITMLETYAMNAGIAFQLYDDYLGVYGEEEVTGKSASCDLREGKHTYLISHFLKHADKDAVRRYQALLGRDDIPQQELDVVKSDIEKVGSRSANTALADDYLAKAVQAIERLDDPFRRSELIALANKLARRDH
jgi:geranylgeranyl pyrophosphate synthase